jgi:hypothetical protein
MISLGVPDTALFLRHSRHDSVKGGVGPTLDKLYPKIQRSQDAMVLISQTALFERPLPPHPEDWDLVLDEVPECISFIEIDGDLTHWPVTRHIQTIESGDLYILRMKDDDPQLRQRMLGRIAVNQPYDQGFDNSYRDLARALIYGFVVIVRKDQWDELTEPLDQKYARIRAGVKAKYLGHVDCLVIVPPQWFRSYRSVTLIGARAMSHLTTLVWQRLYNVTFKLDNHLKLPLIHTPQQSQRVRIHWLYDEPVTRAFMARKSNTGESMFMATCDTVASFHAKLRYKPFLWSAPRPGEDKEYGVSDTFYSEKRRDLGKGVAGVNAFDRRLRLPGRTHGLNKPIFMETRNVSLLSIVGFSPAQLDLLHGLNLTDSEIDKALLMDIAYQDALRCNIRRRADKHVCHITVLDKRIAADTASMFDNPILEPYDIDGVPTARTQRRGRPPSGTRRTDAEKQRDYRKRKAEERRQREEQKREGAR